MEEYQLLPIIRKLEYIALLLSILMIFCGIAAFLISSIPFTKAIRDYQTITNAIPNNPIPFNYDFQKILGVNLAVSLALFIITILCLSIPSAIGGSFLLIYHISILQYSKIILSTKEINWQYPGGEVITNWDNVKNIHIEKRILPSLVPLLYLQLKEPIRPISNNMFRIFFKKPQSKIPIYFFLETWSSDIGKYILQYAPWIKTE